MLPKERQCTTYVLRKTSFTFTLRGMFQNYCKISILRNYKMCCLYLKLRCMTFNSVELKSLVIIHKARIYLKH